MTQVLDAPPRRALWGWVWRGARPYVGWALALLGGVALVLGWYGVSGEALTAKQLPYLVSGGLTGIALVVIAAVFLATEDFRRQLARVDDLQRKVDDLYALFVADIRSSGETATDSSGGTGPAVAAGDVVLVALPAGTSYHRVDCTLVAGKTGAVTVNRNDIARRRLSPCRVCDPPAVG